MPTIKVRRGLEASLPTLLEGEIGFCTDTYKCFIGDGTTNHELLTSVTSGLTWITKSSAYTAVADDGIFVDTSGSAFTITLPASPTLGDKISIDDVSGNFETNNLTIAPNGADKINGVAANVIFDENLIRINFIYSGSTYGWRYSIERVDVVAI